MRLIGTVESEKKAFTVYSILLQEGIHSTYEKDLNASACSDKVVIWVYEEDQVEKASEILQSYLENPSDPRFANIHFQQEPPQPPETIAHSRAKEAQTDAPSRSWETEDQPPAQKKRATYPLTYLVVLICLFFFFWNGSQQLKMIEKDGKLAVQIGMTRVQQKFMFDYPLLNKKINAFLDQYSLKGIDDLKNLPPQQLEAFEKVAKTSNFRGYLPYLISRFKNHADQNLVSPPFTKIREGEIWRLFTPCLLHGGILHILFNMVWAWFLIKQIETRLSKWKAIFLILLIGSISNVAQYFVSGPYFLGFSGVIVGLVGFIWMRQRQAPWEGYPLQKSTFLFILIFVLAMAALEFFSLVTAVITAKEISVNIANTAHIIGGIFGLLLGRLPLFARSAK